jgi:hypothetical protein
VAVGIEEDVWMGAEKIEQDKESVLHSPENFTPPFRLKAFF